MLPDTVSSACVFQNTQQLDVCSVEEKWNMVLVLQDNVDHCINAYAMKVTSQVTYALSRK